MADHTQTLSASSQDYPRYDTNGLIFTSLNMFAFAYVVVSILCKAFNNYAIARAALHFDQPVYVLHEPACLCVRSVFHVSISLYINIYISYATSACNYLAPHLRSTVSHLRVTM